jgi:hypothetical protein
VGIVSFADKPQIYIKVSRADLSSRPAAACRDADGVAEMSDN